MRTWQAVGMRKEVWWAIGVAAVVVAIVSALTAPWLGVLAGLAAMLITAYAIDLVQR